MIAQALLGLLNILNKIFVFKGNIDEIIVLISTDPPFKRRAQRYPIKHVSNKQD